MKGTSVTLFLLFTLSLSTLVVTGCGDDDTVDPTADKPVAAFTVALASLAEGDTVITTNTSTNATTYQWSVMPGGMTSTEKEPSFELRNEGTYTIQLIVTGEGGADTAEQSVTVAANPIFRAFGYGLKTWYVHSLQVGGGEFADDPCYWDNTLNIDIRDSTFSYREGANVCSDGVLPEQEGNFIHNQDLTSIDLMITSPFTGTITYTIDYLTHDTLIVSATLSGGNDIALLATPAIRTE